MLVIFAVTHGGRRVIRIAWEEDGRWEEALFRQWWWWRCGQTMVAWVGCWSIEMRQLGRIFSLTIGRMSQRVAVGGKMRDEGSTNTS